MALPMRLIGKSVVRYKTLFAGLGVIALTFLLAVRRTPNVWRLHIADRKNRAGDCFENPPPYTFKPRLLSFGALYVAIASVLWFISDIQHPSPINYYVTIAWALYLPIGVVGLIGASRVRRFAPSTYGGPIDTLVIFFVPTIGRFDVVPAMARVVASILDYAPTNLIKYRVDVVVDEGAEALGHLTSLYQEDPRVRVVVVPKSFVPTQGTKYKARANHYCTLLRTSEGESRDDVFVYHMDDDTAVGCDTISSIAEFIANDTGRFHVAQGVLTFPRELTPSRFCWLADAVRPADDLSRFHFFTEMLHRPLAGFHGEHLLMRASVEAEIGWDFGPTVKVEDAYFALTFLERYPQHSAFLNSVCYGASPATVRDLIKQRRRWAAGLFAMAFDGRFSLRSKVPLLYAMANWGFGLFQHAGVVLGIAFLLGATNTSPITREIAFIWAFNMSFILWMYFEGLRMNIAVSVRRTNYAVGVFQIVALLLVLSAVEGWSATLGLYDFLTGKHGFEVIAKRT